MNFHELAQSILHEVGGPENIEQVWNCTTRLRFNLIDPSLVDDQKVQQINGVLGTQNRNGQYQIIIGNDVEEVYKEIEKLVGTITPDDQQSNKKKKHVNPFGAVLEIISGIFTPILPAIIGAGMMKCILTILSLTGTVSETSGIYNVFFMISDAAFYFLPFLIACSASRKFKVNEFIGLSVAGVLLYPTLVNGAIAGLEPMKFLGLSIPYLNYSSSIIPIILAIWLLSYVYRFFDKIIPSVFRFILTPVLSLIVTIPITLIVLAPLGNYVGNLMAFALDWLFTTVPPIAGFLLGASFPLLVMTGMHFTIMPVAIQNLALTGYDNFWLPYALISNVAQAGAIFAVMLKSKQKENKSIAFSTGLSALFGVTEPGMFGVTFKLKKPFYAVMLSGGISGLIAAILGVKTYSFSAPNILVLPTYISPEGDFRSLITIIICVLISFVLAFIFTLLLKSNSLDTVSMTSASASPTAKNADAATDESVVSSSSNDTHHASTALIYCPLDGQVVPISQVPDKTFSEEIIGKGVAIEPTDGNVYAPFDGEIIMIFRTMHALAFKSKEGVEVLIHIGIDTVELEGKGFTLHKQSGDFVQQGELILTFDIQQIKDAGYSMITPVVVTNYSEFQDIQPLEQPDVSSKDTPLLNVIL